MADSLKFVGDFRTAASDLIVAINRLDILEQQAADLGYDATTFSGLSGDVSGADFWAAITAWRAVNTEIEGDITALTKLVA